MPKITTKQAIEHLQKKLKKDKEYRQTWEANIAMSFVDAANKLKNKKGNITPAKIGNKAAEMFIDLLIS